MHALSIVLRYYPYWAIPLALSLGELGLHFRRRKKSEQWFFWAMTVGVLLGIGLWLAFRGDLHSDAWAKALLG